jgi:hypothetical protein
MASNVLGEPVFAKFEVLLVVMMKRMVFWVVTRDSLTFLRNISLASSGLKSKPSKLAACFYWFVAWFTFEPEAGGDMFLQNARLSLNYIVLHLRRLHSLFSLFSTNAIHLLQNTYSSWET